ncbi:MAG: PKD domain-containing protein [Candidatus Sericytochromatia bacterium]|uniref:PKD domain-containing protein n=1 Tax=Candidatus Tanganyikabacteria bacterium TaxID=2961651 RepID=A0A937X4V2_9BACT|nr:PKD domain-containing protein [Candidatus Tanganyikabacteria bacterium]
MSSGKALWSAGPLVLLVAGCIIVPGNSSLVSPSYGRSTAGTEIPGRSPTSGGAEVARDTTRRDASRSNSDASVPIIASLTASPTNLTQPGQEVAFHIEAVDLAGTPSYTWSATGGTLTSTAGTRVGWRSPSQPGRYTVLVLVTSQSGGATTGAVNIEVRRDGTAEVLPQSSSPSPSPAASAAVSPAGSLVASPSHDPAICEVK